MFAFTQPRFWVRFFTEFRCHRCGSREGYVSRPRNFFERHALNAVAFRAARCGDCYRRSWRPKRVPLLPRLDSTKFDAAKMVTWPPSDYRETQKETQEPPEGRQRIA